MEVEGGYVSAEEGCRTPKRSECRGPMKCPAAPRKKAATLKHKQPPPNGYFKSPDIEVFFAMVHRREAAAAAVYYCT
uniref:Cyclin-dependent protein kinase inhibitor SMR4 n=1 Tax=Tanacetum cinerariifolium TaxID=118510 RepID=A0A6L2KSB1_TANCI|nr:cyclin-dependent protein kinase inhibitor SMR4 [Tanacetum cinerariifolium]